jgi:hypothetical protein
MKPSDRINNLASIGSGKNKIARCYFQQCVCGRWCGPQAAIGILVRHSSDLSLVQDTTCGFRQFAQDPAPQTGNR